MTKWIAEFAFDYRTEAHSNRRGQHWAVRAGPVKKEREALALAWLQSGSPRPPSYPARVTFTRIAPRKLDAGDNLASAFKGMRDEIAKRIGLRNDAGPEVVWVYEQEKGAPREYSVRVLMESQC